MHATERAVERRISKGEHATIGSNEPITTPVGCGLDTDNRGGEMFAAQRPVELGIAEGEYATVSRRKPVALAVGQGSFEVDGSDAQVYRWGPEVARTGEA